jgi:hypothetical protein
MDSNRRGTMKRVNRMRAMKIALAGIPLRVLLTLSLVGIGFGAGVAAEGINLDRSWWNDTVPEQSRVWVVAGLTDAYNSAWEFGNTAEGVRIEREAGAVLPASSMAALHAIIYRKNANGRYASFDTEPRFSRTFGFYEAGISDFYETHSGAAEATVGMVIGCLADKPQVTCDQVASFVH